MIESNELIKKDFNIDRDNIPLEEQKDIYNELAEKKIFWIYEFRKKINSDNLIYKYKTKGISPKDFSNYQNPTELFKDLRDGNINSKEVLKDQTNFKSDLGKIKNKFNTKYWKIVWFKRKDYWFF